MKINDIEVTDEQLCIALSEISSKNWKVKSMLQSEPVLDDFNTLNKSGLLKQYNNFPKHLKPLLDEMLIEHLKPVIRDNKLGKLLD